MKIEDRIKIMKNRLSVLENKPDASKYTTLRHLRRRIRNLENAK